MLQVKLDAVLARQELLATMPDITPSTPKSKLPQPSTMRGSETPKSMITQRTPQVVTNYCLTASCNGVMVL